MSIVDPPPSSLPSSLPPVATPTAPPVEKKKRSTKSKFSSSSGSLEKEKKPVATPSTSEAVACDLALVYPAGGGEFSFEELKAEKEKKYLEEALGWNGWEWAGEWDKEDR